MAAGGKKSGGAPEMENIKLKDMLSSAKANFLNSTADQTMSKSPSKRSSTPSPEKSKQLKVELLLSPMSLKKAGLGSPPKKKPKLWKSKWQLATLGGFTETGKKKRATEASRLLDDEGVIHMLNRVPSVYGEVPAPSNSGNPRVHRARTAAAKPKHVNTNRNKQKVDRTIKIKKEPVDPVLSPKCVKVEQGSSLDLMQDIKPDIGQVSRNLSSQLLGGNETKVNPHPHSDQEDSFIYLRELPAELLETVMSCDIRYSLPQQGLPNLPSKPVSTKHVPAPQPTKPVTPTKPVQTKPLVPSKPLNQVPCSPSFSRVDQVSSLRTKVGCNPDSDRLEDLRACINNERMSPLKSPGAFSEVYVRLYESFAQVTIAPSKTKLAGSLGPACIDEIIQLLNFVASTRMYKAVILTGLGNVFCQGVDLMYLCHDNSERRAQLAKELASAVERLIFELSRFPKVVVAAVNGVTSGLGLSLLPLCDIVYASEKATFNSFSTRLGYIPEGGASVSLAGIPSSSLSELYLFGRILTSVELKNMGLVNEVFLGGHLMEETIPRVRKGCNAANVGIQWNKIILKQNLKTQLDSVLSAETSLLTEMWSSRDFYKNLVTFLNQEQSLHFQTPS